MNVVVTVQLDADDVFNYSATQVAQRVLTALNAKPDEDFVTATISQAKYGQAGTPPAPPT